MSECTHDCSSCSSNCGERQQPHDFRKPCNAHSHIKKVIAVVSGKGGVGKSTVTCSLAAAMAARGKKVGILDADITGPSIPRAFGIHQHAMGTDDGILPVETAGGIKMMSLNLLTDNETDPVIWRGPVIAGAVEQFWTDVVWGELDYLFVDMPPGTGDVPLTVFQSLPVDGVVGHRAPDPGGYDRHQGRAHGGDDEGARAGPGGELQLLPLPRLRRRAPHLRCEHHRRPGR